MADLATRHVEHVMGTVFSFDVRGAVDLADVVAWLHWVDATFSTYVADSDVSLFGRGEVSLEACAPELAEVLRLCAEVSAVSNGYFTTRPEGHFDPSALVKGWSIERASTMLREAGFPDHNINGGGDIYCGGHPSPGRPWRVGVADPLRPGTVATIVSGNDLAVATSGAAERGCHIVDPHTGEPASGLAGITVVGPSVTLADAYATAGFAMGASAREWVEGLDGYEAFAIAPDGTRWSTTGWTGTVPPPWPVSGSR